MVGSSGGVVCLRTVMVRTGLCVVAFGPGMVFTGLHMVGSSGGVVRLRTDMVCLGGITLRLGVVALRLGIVGFQLSQSCLLTGKIRCGLSSSGGFLTLGLQSRKLTDASRLLTDALLLVLLACLLGSDTCRFVADALLFIGNTLLFVSYALLFVSYALRFVGIGRKGEGYLWRRLAVEVQHHLLLLAIVVDDDSGLIDDFIFHAGWEVCRGEVIAYLELQVTDRQVMVVKLHAQLRGVALHGRAVNVCRAVVAGEVCLAWRTGPELNAEGRQPTCI